VSAEIIAMRPSTGDDAELLWRAWQDAADALDAEMADGKWKIETVARVADTHRAWCRAYCGVAYP
jgi:hypothetical protein